MFSLRDIEPREYQVNIVKTCKDKNVLVVLPTGVGKTAISVMVSLARLNEFPAKKIVVCSPTKPLCQQHVETYKEHTDIPAAQIILYTGVMQPAERKKFWEVAKVIVATPQTIDSDFQNKRIDINDIVLLVIDEAHRSREKYANTVIAKSYMDSSAPHKQILALTASPGHTKDKVKEICENLFIDDVEIRTDTDDDVKRFVQEKSDEFVEVELPEKVKSALGLIKSVYKGAVSELAKVGLNKPAHVVNKKDLLMLQRRLQGEIKNKNPSAFFGLSTVARAVKLDYACELLETQGIEQALEFLNKLESEESKAAKSIAANKQIQDAKKLLQSFADEGFVHPKMDSFKKILEEQIKINPHARTIVFANYRSTVESLAKIAASVPNVHPVTLMGQKEGITQKQQLETISKFESGKYNVLLATSIGEEGLSISGLDMAIFYDHVASSIRRIQRAGRVARVKPGRVVYIVTKNTRDAAFYWKSRRDEKTMVGIMQRMKGEMQKKLL